MMQLFVAVGVAFVVSFLLTPVLIRRFTAEGIGQEIREDGPKHHAVKRGTPTMGGIAIVLALWVGYLAAHLVGFFTTGAGPTFSGVLVLFLGTGMGIIGFLDDYIKVAKQRNLGLNKRGKLAGQIGIGLIFALLLLQLPDENGLTPGSMRVSLFRDFTFVDFSLLGPILGFIAFILFILIVIAAWSNAVNLTDGLDGLAAGTTALVMGAYVAICFWMFRNSCSFAASPGCYDVRDPLDLSVIAGATLGACVGFLWWNAAPAKIFMGDTGSLALGGIVAGLSVTSRTELLMIIIGALFVAEAASVVLQVASFKLTGKRIFRMAPLHHHFEISGWAETQVIIRFWLLAAFAALLGTGLFYADWLSAA